MRGDESEAVSASFTKKPGRICRRVRCCQQLATGNKNVKLDCFILGAYAAIAGGFPYGGCDRPLDYFRSSSTPGVPDRDSINSTKNGVFGTNWLLISQNFVKAPGANRSGTDALGLPEDRLDPQFRMGVIRTQKKARSALRFATITVKRVLRIL
jgi:hypothetical protein